MPTSAVIDQSPATPEEVWAILRETARRQEEDRERWEKERKELNRRMGDLGSRFGELVEHLVVPGMEERFGELGFHFSKISNRQKIVENKQAIAEIDLLMENSECIVAVEVKSKPDLDDIREHAEKLEKLRAWHDKNGDRRRIFGAVAAAIFTEGARQAALKAGFYVVVQAGDTMRLDMPEGFKPKAW